MSLVPLEWWLSKPIASGTLDELLAPEQAARRAVEHFVLADGKLETGQIVTIQSGRVRRHWRVELINDNPEAQRLRPLPPATVRKQLGGV